ncbi:hypothetical protein NHX12_033570 [Muraenolepis orangiensis]|uniref:Hyaluronan/mRNA-binding protein domain-containing protein n=1 Tax=Muraenolepis orangiensis TaxID=630683 RepID=A0A9Q0E1Y8_9TELE|nr:hypothetical protein NHX12_033570 [Muraenolepis orangiensis]
MASNVNKHCLCLWLGQVTEGGGGRALEVALGGGSCGVEDRPQCRDHDSGIGLALCGRLLEEDPGLQLCLACRNMCRAQEARTALLASHPGAQVGLLQLDTSSITSVLNAAKEVKLSKVFNMLATGAGILTQRDGINADGMREVFATNLFGHFLLVRELETLLCQPGRTSQVIWTSSNNAQQSAFSLEDVQHQQGTQPYSSSKYATDLLSLALNTQLNKQFWLFKQKPEALDPYSKYHSLTSGLGTNHIQPRKMDVDEEMSKALYEKLLELEDEAEIKKKEAPAPGAVKPVAPAAKPQKKESQKDRKTPLADKKEETQAPAPIKKDGARMRGMGRRPEGEGQGRRPEGEGQGRRPEGEGPRPQGGLGEGRPPTDRRPVERRPPRRFERPAGEGGEKPEGGEFSVDRPIGDRSMRGRGGPRGARGGRGRGMGRGDGFDARGKREFDRHSGSDRSGLKGEEKRGGSGSHNWGTVKDEMTGELDQSNVTEETPEGEEHPPADSENKENEAEEVKDESPKEMTLDEWKAVQDKERAKAEFNIRQANDGADWKKGYVLHKSKKEEVGQEKDTLNEADADEAPKVEDEHRKPANDITSQLEINFGDLGRPGRGRGGPRGGRGGRGRGEGRGGEGRGESREGPSTRPARGGRSDKASGVSVPNVDDPEAFPALA